MLILIGPHDKSFAGIDTVIFKVHDIDVRGGSNLQGPGRFYRT